MSNSALYTEKRTCILASAFAYVRLFAFRAAHSQLEVFLMGEDLVTIGVGLGLLGFLHNETEYHHIDCQRQNRDYALRCGVGSGGVHRRVHKPVSIHTGDHGELALILEQREHLGKHTPNGQRVGTVLDPAALVPQCVGKGGCQQQSQAAVPGVGGQVVVGVLKSWWFLEE